MIAAHNSLVAKVAGAENLFFLDRYLHRAKFATTQNFVFPWRSARFL
jgi:hypothetical protein